MVSPSSLPLPTLVGLSCSSRCYSSFYLRPLLVYSVLVSVVPVLVTFLLLFHLVFCSASTN